MNKPLYQMIYEKVKHEIKTGKYDVGHQIPTEKQLMELFDVSRLTAKNAMNLLVEEGWITRIPGKGSFVSEEVKGKIVTKKSDLVGVILAGFSDSYGAELLRATISYLNEKGFQCILKISNESQELETEYLNELISLGVRGIIILPVQAEYHNQALLKITLSNFPIVLMDRKLFGLSVPYVGSNNKAIANQMVNKLIELGHQNISVVSHKHLNNSSVSDRIEGIKEAYYNNTMVLDNSMWLLNLETSYSNRINEACLERDFESIHKKIKEHQNITCFFALDYFSGQIVWNALSKLGKKIPEDYSLIGFDGPVDHSLTTSFSRIIQNQEAIAKHAVDLLAQLVHSIEVDKKEVIVEARFIDDHTILHDKTKVVLSL
ncbi:GntR family transcriptional regulator [Aureibacillus halotolerans]|uniref:DNA-binding LacI/PurR family transcriptional regulator n=1 Tax=Aureibacillus halotolerans TaxID=1508390 RepID=A0A4R6TV86_9BACI|nr:GntR family transcriptional regulator [Aureibacillus halotolerans]TDQ37688.1 DNA-binding LacI/PurR family transcriptional regulator [Aureibacillus halotolerans]